jgi:hypothetical protein
MKKEQESQLALFEMLCEGYPYEKLPDAGIKVGRFPQEDSSQLELPFGSCVTAVDVIS